jgi:hypothetical protein
MAKYYNPKPVRDLLRRAATRRIDIAGIWNSEGGYLGHGIETGLFNALWPRYQCYGLPMMSFGASDNQDNAVEGVIGPNWGGGGVEYYMRSNGNGSTWTATKAERAAAPTPQRDIFDVTGLPANSWGPHFPLYCAAGVTGWVAYETVTQTVRGNPIEIGNALTATFWGTEWTSGGGSMAVTVRKKSSPFTVAHNFGTVSYAGTDGVVKKSEASIAADSGRSAWDGIQFFAQTLSLKLFASWFRMIETNKTAGFCLHPLYSRSSMSAYDMYSVIIALPDSSWYHIFDVLTAYQGSDLAEHMCLFDINEGANQAGETSAAAGDPQPADADHPDNLVWYMLQIVTHIEGLWESSGRSLSGLAFNLRSTHPINDDTAEAEQVTFRTALRAIDFDTYPRVTVMDMAEISSRTEMAAAGDYQDATHLTFSGYTRVERKAWQGVLTAGLSQNHGFGGRTRGALRYRG